MSHAAAARKWRRTRIGLVEVSPMSPHRVVSSWSFFLAPTASTSDKAERKPSASSGVCSSPGSPLAEDRSRRLRHQVNRRSSSRGWRSDQVTVRFADGDDSPPELRRNSLFEVLRIESRITGSTRTPLPLEGKSDENHDGIDSPAQGPRRTGTRPVRRGGSEG